MRVSLLLSKERRVSSFWLLPPRNFFTFYSCCARVFSENITWITKCFFVSKQLTLALVNILVRLICAYAALEGRRDQSGVSAVPEEACFRNRVLSFACILANHNLREYLSHFSFFRIDNSLTLSLSFYLSLSPSDCSVVMAIGQFNVFLNGPTDRAGRDGLLQFLFLSLVCILKSFINVNRS